MSTVFSEDEFCIKLTVNGFPEVENIEETIQPYPLFDLFDYKISGKINEDGTGIEPSLIESEVIFEHSYYADTNTFISDPD